jgi:hypothetical protein
MKRLVVVLLLTSCARRPTDVASRAGGDTAFAQLQARGKDAMGVDQYTSAHRFDDLPDGGRIELQRDSTDSAGVRTIREHLQHITMAFGKGDFSLPGFVHADSVPGTALMAANRQLIDYTFRPLPGGGEVLLTSQDPATVSAIHDFLAFQRHDHHAPGMAHGS